MIFHKDGPGADRIRRATWFRGVGRDSRRRASISILESIILISQNTEKGITFWFRDGRSYSQEENLFVHSQKTEHCASPWAPSQHENVYLRWLWAGANLGPWTNIKIAVLNHIMLLPRRGDRRHFRIEVICVVLAGAECFDESAGKVKCVRQGLRIG